MNNKPLNSHKKKALLVISSAKELPLRSPENPSSISTGFFLIEMAQILKEFENEYEFTLSTPNGETPQLDINGLSLPFMATSKLTQAVVAQTLLPSQFPARHPSLVARRSAELELCYKHLGKLPVSEILPNTDKEVHTLRTEVLNRMKDLADKKYYSVQELVERHWNPEDDFRIGDFDFIHFPGGHAPMVDFIDSPWLGELINIAREENVVLSLICHAPIAMTSAKFRIDPTTKNPEVIENHPFYGLRLTTVPKHGEMIALSSNYPKIPHQKTRLNYYVDEALKNAGYQVEITLNPASIKVIWEAKVKLLTSNGPQSIDVQTAQLKDILAAQ